MFGSTPELRPEWLQTVHPSATASDGRCEQVHLFRSSVSLLPSRREMHAPLQRFPSLVLQRRLDSPLGAPRPEARATFSAIRATTGSRGVPSENRDGVYRRTCSTDFQRCHHEHELVLSRLAAGRCQSPQIRIVEKRESV